MRIHVQGTLASAARAWMVLAVDSNARSTAWRNLDAADVYPR